MNSRLLLLFLILMVQSPLAWAQGSCTAPQSQLTNFGYHYFQGKVIDAASPNLPLQLGHPGDPIRYVRLLIKPDQVEEGWNLVIRDQLLRPLQVIDHRWFMHGESTVWTERLPTQLAELSLILSKDLPGFKVEVVAADAMPVEAEHPYYSVKREGNADWYPLYSADFNAVSAQDRLLGDAVGMMTAFTGSGAIGIPTWCCSGSIIATEPKTLFLTNAHCGGPIEWKDEELWKGDVCANTIIDMTWNGNGESTEYICKQVVGVDPKLDAAVLEIEPLTQRRVPPKVVSIRQEAPHAGETLRMVHHPRCLEKKISRGCMVLYAEQSGVIAKTNDFFHQCDSEGGSSGSPIFDSGGRLVGLHHLGFEKTANGSCDGLNKAIMSNALLGFLKSLPVTLAEPSH